MGSGKDIRSERSRYFIKKALIELLETTSLESISVLKITEKAEISRRTFYLYFVSKKECLLAVIEDCLEELFTAGPVPEQKGVTDSGINQRKSYYQRIRLVRKNRYVLRAMFCNLNYEEWMALLQKYYNRQTPLIRNSIPTELKQIPADELIRQQADCSQIAVYLFYLTEQAEKEE